MHYLRFLVACLLISIGTQISFGAQWKFLVYGDSRNSSGGVNTAILGELATQTVSENPAFVLFPGDLVGTGGQSIYNTWKSTMQNVYDAGIGVCPVAGNHEQSGGQSALDAFKNTFITPYTTSPFNGCQNFTIDNSSADGRSYSFNYNDALFLGLDNYANANGSYHRVNQTFLNSRLAARNSASTPLVFAFCHEPAFKCGPDTGLEANPTARNTFWTSLEDAGCRSFFAGHDHMFSHARLKQTGETPDDVNNDVFQYVVGTAGAPFHTGTSYSGDTGTWTPMEKTTVESTYGYVRVVVDDTLGIVTQTWVKRTGSNTFEDTADVTTFSFTPVPEPSTVVLLAIGGILVFWRCNRRAQ